MFVVKVFYIGDHPPQKGVARSLPTSQDSGFYIEPLPEEKSTPGLNKVRRDFISFAGVRKISVLEKWDE